MASGSHDRPVSSTDDSGAQLRNAGYGENSLPGQSIAGLANGHQVARPQILTHSNSHRSISAEEARSTPSRTSERRPVSSDSNEGLLGPQDRRRYSTPPQSPPLSPIPRHERFESEDITYLPSGAQPAPTSTQQTVRFDGSTIRRKPVPSDASSRYSGTGPRISQMSYDTSPPTPGADDSSYIRFAIDQLTRDEEVRAESRAYPAASAAQPLLPVAATAEVGSRSVPAPAPAYQRPEQAAGSQWTQYEYHSDALSTPETLDHEDLRGRSARVDSPSGRAPELLTHQAPGVPAERLTPLQTQGGAFEAASVARGQPDVFVPFEQGGSPLNFRPIILKPLGLGIYFLLLHIMLVGLIFTGVWSGTHEGLWQYTQFGGGRYFIFQYLPTLGGTYLLMWLFQIQTAVQRLAPFIAMASPAAKARTEGPLLDYFPTQFLYPNLQHFRSGQFVLGCCMVSFWLQIFTLPLLTVVFNVYFYGDNQTGEWRWNANQIVTWILVGLYSLQSIAVVVLLIWINRQRTGLKWDPRSIADLVALLDRSNIMSDYAGSETWALPKLFRDRLCDRSDRLGYWQTSKRPNDSFYGIGEEGGVTRRYTLEAGIIREKGPTERSSFPDTPATAEAPLEDLESGDVYNAIRYRYLPWYLRPSLLLLWCIAALLLYVAFLIVSYVNDAVIRGFSPLTPVSPSPSGYSATNFVYSFVPAIISSLLFICWLSIDQAYRRLAPYANMSSPFSSDGATADRSLLLDYPFRLPLSITYASIKNRNLRVTWFSTMSIISAALPTLAGGCFWAQFYIPEQQVRVAVDPAGYYALNVFLALYVVSLPFAFIGLRQHRLPHKITTLAEQISFLYQSRILGEREWRNPLGAKNQMASRFSTASTDLEKEGPGAGRFIFGKFIGRDGKTHLGIERLGRSDPEQNKRPVSKRRTMRDSGMYMGLGSGKQSTEVERVPVTPSAPLPESYTANNHPGLRSGPGSARWLHTPQTGTPFSEAVASAVPRPAPSSEVAPSRPAPSSEITPPRPAPRSEITPPRMTLAGTEPHEERSPTDTTPERGGAMMGYGISSRVSDAIPTVNVGQPMATADRPSQGTTEIRHVGDTRHYVRPEPTIAEEEEEDHLRAASSASFRSARERF